MNPMNPATGNLPFQNQNQVNPGNPGGEKPNSDLPPFSRVFVVCSRNHKEDDIRAAFQQFGVLEDVWMVKDRMTKENKGICYVKYDKASTAAVAIESLDGKTIGTEPKPIKVCVYTLGLVWGHSTESPLHLGFLFIYNVKHVFYSDSVTMNN